MNAILIAVLAVSHWAVAYPRGTEFINASHDGGYRLRVSVRVGDDVRSAQVETWGNEPEPIPGGRVPAWMERCIHTRCRGVVRRGGPHSWSELSPEGWMTFSEGWAPLTREECPGVATFNAQTGTGVEWRRICLLGRVLSVNGSSGVK